MARAMAAPARNLNSEYMRRWIAIWVVLLSIVTLVAVAFLVAITNELAGINADLAVADDEVSGIGTETRTLPDQVERVNASLGGIDPNLKPIPAGADQIIARLRSIESKLANTDGSLKDTNGVLKTVLGQTADIRNVLVDADDPADRLGVQNIHQRVAFLNGTGNTGPFGANASSLSSAKADTGNILAELAEVNKHLVAICRSLPVTLLGGGGCS